jgi:hypothetical protein
VAIANVLPYRGDDDGINVPRMWHLPAELVSGDTRVSSTDFTMQQDHERTISMGWTDQVEGQSSHEVGSNPAAMEGLPGGGM